MINSSAEAVPFLVVGPHGQHPLCGMHSLHSEGFMPFYKSRLFSEAHNDSHCTTSLTISSIFTDSEGGALVQDIDLAQYPKKKKKKKRETTIISKFYLAFV